MITNHKLLWKTLALSLASLWMPSVMQAQTNVEIYGQNRVQYRRFEWKFFETEHFRIYHYDASGRQLARYISEQAERDIGLIEKKLGGQFPHRFNIILYNNYDEYRQTNVGRKYESQLQDVPTGTVDLVGDRLVVYFTGVHADLRRQMRMGMSEVVLARMLLGEKFRDKVAGTILLNLPKWVSTGFISYLVDGWDAASDSEWKNLLAAYPGKGFAVLSEEHPELAGKAFWKYISSHYGEENVKNLIYTVQLKSNLNKAFQTSIGMTIKDVYDSCITFYKGIYLKDNELRTVPDSSKALITIPFPKNEEVIKSFRVAPKGHDIAYVSWKEGEYKVYMQHTDHEQARSVILQGGRKDYNELKPDPDYPMLAWSNNGYKLAIMYREGTRVKIRIYNSMRARIENYTIPENRFDRVLGLTFMEDDQKIVFSAIRKSQSDIYEFTFKGSKLKNITNDSWDDIQPQYISGGMRKGILFLSNRTSPNIDALISVNELPVGPMNVFFYNTTTGRKELLQCTHITRGTISQPIQYGSDNFAFLYDTSGVQNKYVVLFARSSKNTDSAYALPVTNYTQSILSHQYNPASQQVAEVVADGPAYKVYFRDLQMPGKDITPPALRPTLLSRVKTKKDTVKQLYIPAQVYKNEQSAVSSMKAGSTFRSEFDTRDNGNTARAQEPVQNAQQETDTLETVIKLPEVAEDNEPDSTYLKMRAQPYRLSLKPDFLTLRIDNTILFQRYQSTKYNSGNFTNPPLSGLLTISLNDPLENYRLTGGFRIGSSLADPTYFFEFENATRRVDWSILYLRTNSTSDYDITFVDSSGAPIGSIGETGRVTTNLLQGTVSYPLDRIRSIRMHVGLRQDVLNFKAKDTIALALLPQSKQYWTMSRAEYVFDNSYNPALNIRRGYRYKFFAEYMYQLNDNGGGMYNLGVDFRYYHKIYKNFIWASRFAYAHSGGKQKVLYYLGGVDNWIGASFDKSPGIDPRQNYGFQTIATNMRGYKQGARNGNTYAVLNEELRFPITTLIKRPVTSKLIKNLQFIAFTDVGAAWNGLLPNEDNLKNRIVLGPDPQAPNTQIILIQDKSSGIAVGYGAGIRTMILGYFMRLDAAWNIDPNPRPILYFSLGTDF